MRLDLGRSTVADSAVHLAVDAEQSQFAAWAWLTAGTRASLPHSVGALACQAAAAPPLCRLFGCAMDVARALCTRNVTQHHGRWKYLVQAPRAQHRQQLDWHCSLDPWAANNHTLTSAFCGERTPTQQARRTRRGTRTRISCHMTGGQIERKQSDLLETDRKVTTPADRRPVVISGPSGVGKGTLITKLLEKYPDTFVTTVSHTSRKPRAGEVEGRAYYFVSEPEFLSLISRGAFIESTHFSGNYYGTSKQTVLDQTAQGRVVILDIEMQGAKAIKADPNLQARYVFVKPPSLEALEHRLRGRSTEDEESIQRRLAQARLELEEADRSNTYEVSIVNDDVDTAFQELLQFIFATKV
ncbi:hypothetical protein FH972_026228 [Carpinus fangiana]|uniref:guanylate kinase n=1 Tax=Carpinus fangiana TaxID=176857 RepID=A0A5N6L3R1_9ROSI|nr:hypothetical protein FH972_026228 [Carpinus fangiana]